MTAGLAQTPSLFGMKHTIHYFDRRVRDEISSWPGDTLADYGQLMEAVMRFGLEPWIPRLRRATWGVTRARFVGATESARVFLCVPEARHVLVVLAHVERRAGDEWNAGLECLASRRMRTYRLPRSGFHPVAHDHAAFIHAARTKPGFDQAFESLADEYVLARECIRRRRYTGLTQLEVAWAMGTTDSAVSRLEHARGLSPSLATMRRYACAVGCDLEVRLVPRGDDARTG